MKKNRQLKQLSFGILALLLIGFFSGCAASGAAADATADAGGAGGSGKKGRKAKKEVYSPVGEWQYSVETPNGGGSGIMKVTGEPGTYEVVLETDQFGELRVYDLDMTSQNMSGKIDVAGFTAGIEGDFEGDDFIGYLSLGDDAFPIEATRTSKGG